MQDEGTRNVRTGQALARSRPVYFPRRWSSILAWASRWPQSEQADSGYHFPKRPVTWALKCAEAMPTETGTHAGQDEQVVHPFPFPKWCFLIVALPLTLSHSHSALRTMTARVLSKVP